MKRLVMILAALALPATLHAAPMTPCTGSWDGPGMTACELLGRQGSVGDVFNAHDYLDGFTSLFTLTAYGSSNVLTVLPDGAMEYRRHVGHPVFTTSTHPGQFAYWYYPTYTMVGIEDLGFVEDELSDYDHNDYIVRVERAESVPEPATFGLLIIGVGAALRRRLVA